MSCKLRAIISEWIKPKTLVPEVISLFSQSHNSCAVESLLILISI